MEKHEWQMLKELFHHAIDLPPEEREKFIEAQSSREPWLKEELPSLIDAHEKEGPFLDMRWQPDPARARDGEKSAVGRKSVSGNSQT